MRSRQGRIPSKLLDVSVLQVGLLMHCLDHLVKELVGELAKPACADAKCHVSISSRLTLGPLCSPMLLADSAVATL